jgi:DNA-binding MarR family transcriptional regulator
MKEIYSEDEVSLSPIFHRLIRAMQRTSLELWGTGLDGATTIEVSILSIVEHKPDVILKEIVEFLGIPGSTLTSAIDRLEKRGFIRRIISNRDRRSFGLELTEKGEEVQMEHRKGEQILMERILKAFSTPEEQSNLIRVLEKLSEKLEEKS